MSPPPILFNIQWEHPNAETSPTLYLLPWKHWDPFHVFVSLRRLQTVCQSVLSSHALSTPGLLVYEQKPLKCGPHISEEYRWALHVSADWSVIPLRYFCSSKATKISLPIWSEPFTAHPRVTSAEGGSVFKTLLCPSVIRAGPCSFPILSWSFFPLEHRVRVKSNEHPCDTLR